MRGSVYCMLVTSGTMRFVPMRLIASAHGKAHTHVSGLGSGFGFG